MENDDLLKHCKDLQLILTHNDLKDEDGLDLFSELIIFRSLVDEDTNSLQALNILKTTNGSFPNLTIALRIMLTIPVTSACAERSFSKLKLIKTYLRNRLGQDKLSELALISIEGEASLMIKISFDNMSCCQFYESILANKTLLQKVHSSAKYQAT
ncbi:hypothetical protein QTP88_020999 [Uroleucon formosanum]